MAFCHLRELWSWPEEELMGDPGPSKGKGVERVHILVCGGASQTVELPAIAAFLRKVVTVFLKLVPNPAPGLITLH